MLAGIYMVGAWLAQATVTTNPAVNGTSGTIRLKEDVNVAPNKVAIPGSDQVQSVVNGMAGWGLILALAAMIIAGVIWAFGAQSQNHHQATQGKRGVLIAAGAAALMTAAPAFVNWASGLGTAIK
ncbi:MAG: DUF6112 family protein [Acidimicrobiia bacterium]